MAHFSFLKENNQVKGLGLEIDHQKIQKCLQKGRQRYRSRY